MREKNGSRGFMPLVRQLQFAIALTTIVPLLSLSYLILRYVAPSVLAREGIAALLIAIMALMLTGTRMIFRLINRAGTADTTGPPSGQGFSMSRKGVPQAAG